MSHSKTALVVIGYGQNEETALRTAYNTITKDYQEMERKYIEEWRDYCASLMISMLIVMEMGKWLTSHTNAFS